MEIVHPGGFFLRFKFCLTIFAPIHLVFRVGEHKDLLQFLLDRSNTARIFTKNHVMYFLRQMELLFFNDLVILNDIDCDAVVNVA